MSKDCSIIPLDEVQPRKGVVVAPSVLPATKKANPATRIDLKLGKIKVRITSAHKLRVSEDGGAILLRVEE